MTRYHATPDGHVPYTPEEEAARDAEEAAEAALSADRETSAHNAPILAHIEALDAKLVRPVAEVAEALATGAQPNPVSVANIVMYNADKANLRAQLK